MPFRTTAFAELFLIATVTASAGPATSPGPTACDWTDTTLTIDAVTSPPRTAVLPTDTAARVVTATAGTVFETFPPPGAGTGVVRVVLAEVGGAVVVGATAEPTAEDPTGADDVAEADGVAADDVPDTDDVTAGLAEADEAAEPAALWAVEAVVRAEMEIAGAAAAPAPLEVPVTALAADVMGIALAPPDDDVQPDRRTAQERTAAATDRMALLVDGLFDDTD